MKKFKIYVDADGVITDFDKRSREIGFDPEEYHKDSNIKSEFWKTVDKNFKKGIGFWIEMDMLNDAKELMNYNIIRQF